MATTTYEGAGRNLVQTTQGAGAPVQQTLPGVPNVAGLDPGLLERILQWKINQKQQPYRPAGQAPRQAEAPQPRYTPQMGSSSAQPFEGGGRGGGVVTRMVSDPRVSPYFKMQYGRDAPSVLEKGYRDSNGRIQWEFSDGGGRGEGARGTIDPKSEPSGGYDSSDGGYDRMGNLNMAQDEASFGDQRRQAAAAKQQEQKQPKLPPGVPGLAWRG